MTLRGFFVAFFFALFAAVVSGQEIDSARADRIRKLVEQLGADDWQVRKEATYALIGEGLPALPSLKEAANSSDAEVAQRAKYVVQIVEKTGGIKFSSSLVEAYPQVYDDLVGAGSYQERRSILEKIREFAGSDEDFANMDIFILHHDGNNMPGQEKRMLLSQIVEIPVAALRPAAGDIAALLKDNDPVIRAKAVVILGKIGANEHVNVIVDLLNDRADDVRSAALVALVDVAGKVPDAEKGKLIKTMLAIPENRRDGKGKPLSKIIRQMNIDVKRDLCPLLLSADTNLRRGAFLLLCDPPAPEYAGEIASRLRDWDDVIRERAAIVLGVLKANEHAAKVALLLCDKSPAVRCAAVKALDGMEAKEYTAAIAPLLADDDATVRATATAFLKKRAPIEAVNLAVHLKASDYLEFKLRADAAAAGIMDKEHARDFVRFLSDEGDYLRAWASDVLTELKSVEVARDVVPLLHAKNEYTRSSAYNVLSRMQIPEIAEDLVPLLKHELPDVRTHAAFLLGDIGAGEKYADKIAPLLKDSSEHAQVAAVMTLCKAKVKTYGGDMTPLLKSPSYYTRYAALGAFGDLGAVEFAKDIAPLLKDPSISIRSTAATTLARIGANQYAGEIAELLEIRDPYHLKLIIDALISLKAKDELPKIVKLAGDKNSEIQIGVIEAIAAMEGRQYIGMVADMLGSRSWDIRGRAGTALVELGAKDRVTGEKINDIILLSRYGDDIGRRAENALKALGLTDEEIRKKQKDKTIYPK